jgi:MoxR-like ATPase
MSDGWKPPQTTNSSSQAQWFADRFASIEANVSSIIIGKKSAVRLALVCLLAEGHLLVEDVPGVGKTSLARAIANSIDGTTTRIQFTPDLLPQDVSGSSIWNANTREFEYRPGPVFANIVVGDEINRASPKTQSALLEVMEERQVTVDGVPYAVPKPFMVLATQNPIELEGTYPLPEAQIDRFMMRMSMGYPDAQAEVDIIRARSSGRSVDELAPVADIGTIQRMIELARDVFVAPSLFDYVVAITSATRRMTEVRLGVSPRGSLALIQAAHVYAAVNGRFFATVKDIQVLAPYVLAHRLLLTSEAELGGHTAVSLLGQITSAVPVPEERSVEV